MKFEKFFKRVGTYGQVLNRTNGDKWLIAEGVGVKIPFGVNSLLGSGEVPEKVKTLVEGLINADTDDKVILTRAQITPDGKASNIIRVFGDKLDIEVGITNADFGLLEKSDINLAEVEIDDTENYYHGMKFLLILDGTDEAIGFITGVPTV